MERNVRVKVVVVVGDSVGGGGGSFRRPARGKIKGDFCVDAHTHTHI